jgi:hypothetical protein
VTTLQEHSPRITYSGTWTRAGHAEYLGGSASSTNSAGATASLTFTGRSIAWIGPTGPTRGMADVYLNGRFVRTINTYSARFTASRVLFSSSFATERERTLTIEALGTAGHPTVAIDALEIRGGETQEPSTATKPGPQPTPTPRPARTPPPGRGQATPTPTPAPTPTPVAAVTPTPGPTPGPTGTPAPAPTPSATPTPTPAPVPQPTPVLPSNAVKVTSITALLAALSDDAITEIVVANGTYRVGTAASQRSNSLWIGRRFAGRTTPVTVRAETRGGVVFDGGGSTFFGGISFEEGAHHQTWDGFVFANGVPTHTGVITFGGYAGSAAAHNITLRNITLTRTLTSSSIGITDHGVYVAHAVGGVHDVLIDGLTVDGTGGLDSAVHFYHSTSGNPNAWNFTMRGLRVNGTSQAVILWDGTLRNVVLEDSAISGAGTAVRYEIGGSVTLRRVVSTASRLAGFFSTLGLRPPGVTIVDSTFN